MTVAATNKGISSVAVRFICTEIGVAIENGAVDGRVIHSITLAPDPTDDSYIHGTVLRLGLFSAIKGLKVGQRFRLTLTEATEG